MGNGMWDDLDMKSHMTSSRKWKKFGTFVVRDQAWGLILRAVGSHWSVLLREVTWWNLSSRKIILAAVDVKRGAKEGDVKIESRKISNPGKKWWWFKLGKWVCGWFKIHLGGWTDRTWWWSMKVQRIMLRVLACSTRELVWHYWDRECKG